MKIKRSRLKQIIKEEKQRIEAATPERVGRLVREAMDASVRATDALESYFMNIAEGADILGLELVLEQLETLELLCSAGPAKKENK